MQDTHASQMNETHPVGHPLDVVVDFNSSDPGKDRVLDWGADLVVIAHIEDPISEGCPTRNARFVMISPTGEAFEHMAKHNHLIISLSIMVAGMEVPDTTYSDRIVEVSSSSARTPEGRALMLLRTESGDVIGVEDNRTFFMRSELVHWSGKGVFRGGAVCPAVAPA